MCVKAVDVYRRSTMKPMMCNVQAAIDADPKNPLAKFEKAAVLISQEQYQPALNELKALKVCFISSRPQKGLK